MRPPFIGVVTIGSATPKVTAVIKLDDATNLDLHFYFLDLGDHPCSDSFDVPTLNAASAMTSPDFKNRFLGTLFTILSQAKITGGTITYEDALGHPDLDAIDVGNAAKSPGVRRPPDRRQRDGGALAVAGGHRDVRPQPGAGHAGVDPAVGHRRRPRHRQLHRPEQLAPADCPRSSRAT